MIENQKYFNDASVVLNIDVPEDEVLGCIFISVEKAVELSKLHMQTLEREIGHTVVRGVLQLTGNNPKTEIEEAKLRDREEYIMYLLCFYTRINSFQVRQRTL